MSAPGHRVGYVLKVYPRFSETFVVSEILAREAQGEQLEIFSLRHSTDPRFHPEPARVQAPVTHVGRPERAAEGWAVLARAAEVVPGFAGRLAALLPELARTEASEVHQGVALATAVVEHGITHLHAHFASLAARVAEIASRLTGVPFTVTTHAKDIFHESVDPDRLRRTLARARTVVAISEHNRRHLAGRFPEHAATLRLVRNGLELERFPYRDPRPPGERLHVAAVGRLVPKKGFDRLLHAAARLRAEGRSLRLSIAGGGELAGPLGALAARLGLEDAVELLGPRTQAEVAALLRTADVFAAPCVVGPDGNADGLPTVLLEAMAMGVPVVATDVTGIPEAVREGPPRTGLLVPADDVAALARALARAADPGFDRVGTARAARALVEREHDGARQAAALRALLPPAPPARPTDPAPAAPAPEGALR
ncbi:glycosyltransferase [Kocuria flava]|uniref:Colanic acid biosynthesis glycosyltransferase WcaL n=1 Tax=Kocuria flava TaxID=446860 RepID=A0ABQ0XBC1_9MICC|nr:glycosyltransferase [Kocuria flava]GEO92944.1 colanic acid biosynthesis glycosyltransferase WcaL [Kocuria flava]